jgi:hypothetical protein
MTAPVASGWSGLPGGARTHWKAPPCHGAHVLRTSRVAAADIAVGQVADLGTTVNKPFTGAKRHGFRRAIRGRRNQVVCIYSMNRARGYAHGREAGSRASHGAGRAAVATRMYSIRGRCMNVINLGDPVGFESLEDGRASQRKLASLSFDAAGFGHGKPIAKDASTHFRKKWGETSSA